MKGWEKCPDCWGTGFVGGFQAACEKREVAPREVEKKPGGWARNYLAHCICPECKAHRKELAFAEGLGRSMRLVQGKSSPKHGGRWEAREFGDWPTWPTCMPFGKVGR